MIVLQFQYAKQLYSTLTMPKMSKLFHYAETFGKSNKRVTNLKFLQFITTQFKTHANQQSVMNFKRTSCPRQFQNSPEEKLDFTSTVNQRVQSMNAMRWEALGHEPCAIRCFLSAALRAHMMESTHTHWKKIRLTVKKAGNPCSSNAHVDSRYSAIQV